MLPTALYPRQTREYMAREYRREELEFVASSEGGRPVQTAKIEDFTISLSIIANPARHSEPP